MKPKQKTKTLENCPLVVSVKKLELENELEYITDLEIRKIKKAELSRVELYRFTYKVNKLIVVGFVAYPKKAIHLPCIIHLRGGSREFGKMDTPQIVRGIVSYANAGYVVISTQYPGVDGGTGRDSFGGPDDIVSIKNLKKILDWLPQADSSQIGMKGHSRGGLMIYMMLREVSWIKVVVIGGAPTDEFRAGRERKGWRAHQILTFGKSKAELIKRSPIRWVKELPKKTPILLVHGSADWRVLADHSIQMSGELYKNKIPFKFILFEGADHGITEFFREYRDQTLSWFKKYLKKDRILPNMNHHGI